MNNCPECEQEECYECWLIGNSNEAKQFRMKQLDEEIKRVFK